MNRPASLGAIAALAAWTLVPAPGVAAQKETKSVILATTTSVRDTGLLDVRTGLLLVYTLVNLPIVVWMLFSFFKEVPPEILEAGRMDGAHIVANGPIARFATLIARVPARRMEQQGRSVWIPVRRGESAEQSVHTSRAPGWRHCQGNDASVERY